MNKFTATNEFPKQKTATNYLLLVLVVMNIVVSLKLNYMGIRFYFSDA